MEENDFPENVPFLSPITPLLPLTPRSMLNTDDLPSGHGIASLGHIFCIHPFPHPRRRASWILSWKRERKQKAAHGNQDGGLTEKPEELRYRGKTAVGIDMGQLPTHLLDKRH